MPAPALLILALAIDILSLILAIARIIRGRGPSGIPVVSWLIYYVLVEWMHQTFGLGSPLKAIGVLTLIHLSCQFLIPAIVRLAKRNSGASL